MVGEYGPRPDCLSTQFDLRDLLSSDKSTRPRFVADSLALRSDYADAQTEMYLNSSHFSEDMLSIAMFQIYI